MAAEMEVLALNLALQVPGAADTMAALNGASAAADKTTAAFAGLAEGAAATSAAMGREMLGGLNAGQMAATAESIARAAAALKALGIEAKTAGAGTNALVVAERDLANAQAILGKVAPGVIAMTREQAAAYAAEAEAAKAAMLAQQELANASRIGAIAPIVSRGGGGAIPPSGGGAALAEGAGDAERAAGAFGILGTTLGSVYGQLLALYAVFKSGEGIKDAIDEGLHFNQVLENSRLGIASIITAMGELEDASGRMLTGGEAFAAATAIADDQMAKLRVDSLQTASTVEQLATNMQGLIGVGLRAGATVDQIRKLTVDATLAAGALNIPYSQITITLLQALEGHARITNRLAAELGFTSAQLQLWKEQGTLVEHLVDTFGKFEAMGPRVLSTWSGIKSNMVDTFQIVSGFVTGPLLKVLEEGFTKFEHAFLDFNTGQISSKFAGLASTIGGALAGAGKLFVDALNAGVSAAERLSAWASEHAQQLRTIGAAWLDIIENVGSILLSLTEIAAKTVLWVESSIVVRGLLQSAADLTGLIARNIGTIAATLGVIAGLRVLGTLAITMQGAAFAGMGLGAALLSLLNPVTLIIGGLIGLAAVVGAANVVLSEHERAIQAARTADIQNAQSAAQLTAEYKALVAVLTSSTATTAQKKAAQEQLKTVTDQLVALSPAYRQAIESESTDLTAQLKAIEALTAAREKDLRAKLDASIASVKALEAEQKALTASLELLGKQGDEVAFEGTRRELDANVTALARAKAATHEYAIAIGEMQAAAAGKTGVTAKGPPTDTTTTDKDRQALADAQITKIKANLAAQHAALDASLAADTISYREYYQRLTDMEVDALNQEIVIREKLAASEPDQGKREKDLAQVAQLQAEIAETVQLNAEAERAAVDRTTSQILSAEAKRRAANGETMTAALQNIGREAEAYNQALIREGASEADRVAKVRAFTASQIQLVEFKEQETALDRELAALATQKERIQEQVKLGILTEAEGAKAIAAAEALRAPKLQEMLTTLTQMAALLHDPAMHELVVKLKLEIDKGLSVPAPALTIAEQAAKQLGEAFKSTLTDSISAAFQDIGSGQAQNAFGDLTAGLLSGLGGMLEQFGAAVITTGALMAKALAALQSLNPVAALAAGAALIALGALLQGAAQSAFGGGGGGDGGSSGYAAPSGPVDTTTTITYFAPATASGTGTAVPSGTGGAPLGNLTQPILPMAAAQIPAPAAPLAAPQPSVTVTGNTFVGSWNPEVQRIMMREISLAQRRGF